jgi:hypothetical protein
MQGDTTQKDDGRTDKKYVRKSEFQPVSGSTPHYIGACESAEHHHHTGNGNPQGYFLRVNFTLVVTLCCRTHDLQFV